MLQASKGTDYLQQSANFQGITGEMVSARPDGGYNL